MLKNRRYMTKEKKIGKVNVYGEIYPYGDNSATAFIERFNEACKGTDRVNVYLHTKGGDVMEGTLIYNHIKACKIPVDVYIVGVCCSMGTVFMMAAGKIYMCENSYIMIHAPQGGCYGTASEMEKAAKGLRGMERNFKKIYAAKTGKDEDGVKELLEGDNWFTAQEAMEANLIDGIVAPIATDVTQISAEELKTQSPSALYDQFSACLSGSGSIGDQGISKSSNNKKESKMDKVGLIQKFGLTGVTAQSSDEAIEEAIQKKLNAAEQRAQQAEEQIEADKKKRIVDVVAAAKDAGKITAGQVSVYVGIGETSGLEALEAVLKDIKVSPSLVDMARGGSAAQTSGSTLAARAGWTWDQWQKEDPRGLEVMEKNEPEKFEALYKAAFK